jgi:cobalt-zinc-cadmium efflux system protein
MPEDGGPRDGATDAHRHAHHRAHGPSPGHDDGLPADADRRYLSIALALITAYMAVEVVVSVLSHSLALLADAGHMLTDAGAIGASMWAVHLAQRPSSPVWSYGLKRAEILAAATNGVALVVVGFLVGAEAVRRLVHPHHVAGGPMLAVALIGVAVNLAATAVVAHADRRSLNIEGAFRHILTDLFGFIGTAVAAVVIIATGWDRADPVASLLVVVLVLWAAWGLLKASGHILLEGTPEAIDLGDVRRHLSEVAGVIAVHDLHAWTLTSALPALTAHIVVTDACFQDGSAGVVLDRLQRCLADHFDVEHSTFQLEAASHAAHEPGTHD